MNIIINHTSMQPIYEQINAQIKALVIAGDLKTQEMLPSVRTLAKELKISALTVKKAYDSLEEEGFVVTVQRQLYCRSQSGAFAGGAKENRGAGSGGGCGKGQGRRSFGRGDPGDF